VCGKNLCSKNRQDACSTKEIIENSQQKQAGCLFHKRNYRKQPAKTGRMPVPQKKL
jgi:hypothetical protein